MKRLTPIIVVALLAAVSACNSTNASSANGAPKAAAGLVVETAEGDLTFEPRNIENGACSSDDCVDFKRVDQAPEGYALIHKIYYEGSEWLLIDTQNGAQLTLSAQPNFNPYEDRLIVVNSDETGDGSGSGSFVYEHGEDGVFVQLAKFGMEDFVPIEFVGWAGSDCANIQGYTGWGKPGFDTSTTKDASIARMPNGDWALSLHVCPAAG